MSPSSAFVHGALVSFLRAYPLVALMRFFQHFDGPVEGPWWAIWLLFPAAIAIFGAVWAMLARPVLMRKCRSSVRSSGTSRSSALRWRMVFVSPRLCSTAEHLPNIGFCMGTRPDVHGDSQYESGTRSPPRPVETVRQARAGTVVAWYVIDFIRFVATVDLASSKLSEQCSKFSESRHQASKGKP